jgi:hypothetical protein
MYDDMQTTALATSPVCFLQTNTSCHAFASRSRS